MSVQENTLIRVLPSIIVLNVGGKIFQTTKATLKKYSGLIARIRCENTCPLDGKGHIFIDRNPVQFAKILEIARTNVITLPTDIVQRKAIMTELEYFGMTGAITTNLQHFGERKHLEYNKVHQAKNDGFAIVTTSGTSGAWLGVFKIIPDINNHEIKSSTAFRIRISPGSNRSEMLIVRSGEYFVAMKRGNGDVKLFWTPLQHL